MLGGGSDGAHNVPDYREKQANFMQFAGKERAQSLHAVYRERAVTRRAARPAGCRHRHRHRSSGDAGSRLSRRRGAAPQGPRARAAGPVPRTARRCPSEPRPSRSCRCRPSLPSWWAPRSCAWSSSRGVRARLGGGRLGTRRPGRARRGVAAARVGLALLRECERATDLFLRVRVVEDVRRKLRDRLGVAVERVDLARPCRRRTSRR